MCSSDEPADEHRSTSGNRIGGNEAGLFMASRRAASAKVFACADRPAGTSTRTPLPKRKMRAKTGELRAARFRLR